MQDLIYKDECYKIVGACFEVYRDKGCGFLEAVCQECLEIEFQMQGILFVPKKPLGLTYKGRSLKQRYEPDFICFDKIILEIKAVSALVDEHRAQVINYLNATGFKLGLLINFGHYPKLEWERIAHTARETSRTREGQERFSL
jgi:GxxExxY protein